jgi:hypothetical protein
MAVRLFSYREKLGLQAVGHIFTSVDHAYHALTELISSKTWGRAVRYPFFICYLDRDPISGLQRSSYEVELSRKELLVHILLPLHIDFLFMGEFESGEAGRQRHRQHTQFLRHTNMHFSRPHLLTTRLFKHK